MSAFFLLVCALSFHAAGAPKKHQPANIVLIVADYMGYADIEPFGAKDIKTPSLMALANRGVKFSNYYAAAPICVPSRAALLSGRYPEKVLRMQGPLSRAKGLPSSHNTLVNQLTDMAYKTAVIGKWHLGLSSGFAPLDHGFDTFFGFDDWALGYHDHLTSNGEPGLMRGRELVEKEGYLTELFSDEAVGFIDANQGQPFFLYLSYNSGLPPYQRPDLPAAEWGKGWKLNEASRADYVAMVESMDKGIGQVLAALDRHNLTGNTLVIFTYDHGGRHLTDSGPLFHGFSTLWEGGIRVPMLLSWPQEVNGRQENSDPAIAMDLTATMLDAAGVEPSKLEMDGLSLLPSLVKNEQMSERSFFWQWRNMKAVRRGPWKLVVDGGSQLLFDLNTDPGERRNRFRDKQELAAELSAELKDWEDSFK